MTARYDPVGTRPSGHAQPGASAVMMASVAYFGARNLGVYVNRPNSAGGGLSVHAEGRAGDSGFTTAQRHAGDAFAAWLVSLTDELYVQVVIWQRRIWSATHATWRPYTGPNPHTDHVHWEVNWTGARWLTAETIARYRPGAEPPPAQPSEDDDVTRPFTAAHKGGSTAWLCIPTGGPSPGLVKMAMADPLDVQLPPNGYGPLVEVDREQLAAIPTTTGSVGDV